jgi:hypothetical protein
MFALTGGGVETERTRLQGLPFGGIGLREDLAEVIESAV